MPVEPEEKKDVPPAETRCQGQQVPPPPGGGSDDASVSEEGPQELSKSPPDSSSTSSSPDSDLDLGGHCRNKELRLRLSPENVISAKRCLWDVDRKEVEESLSREFKRIRQEESVVKSMKWNYDFEKDVPIKGPWHWKEAEEPPDFYKPKIYPSKKASQKRASPYEKPPKRRSLETVSSSVGSSSSSSSDMAASSSTSTAPSLSSYLVSTSNELSVLASNVSSTSSTTTKDCEKPSSPVQVASESSEIFEGKEKSSKDSLSLVVASSSVDSSSSSSGEDRRMTLPSSKTSNVRQENVKLELISVPEVSKLEDTPILSTCTSPASICGMVNVSSSDSSKASVSRDSSSSNNNNSRNNNNGQNVSDVKNICSSTSGTTPGIVPSQFYSVESADPGSEGGTSSSCTSTNPSPKTTKKEKGKAPPPGKPPKPPNSGESSSSHLLKYYR